MNYDRNIKLEYITGGQRRLGDDGGGGPNGSGGQTLVRKSPSMKGKRGGVRVGKKRWAC